MRKLSLLTLSCLTLATVASCGGSSAPNNGSNGGGDGGGNTQPLTLNFGPATSLPVQPVDDLISAAGSNPQSIAAGDVNRDGKADIVAALEGNNAGDLVVFLGKGDGTFEPKKDFNGISGSKTVVLADLNGDTNLDMAASNGTTITVHLNDGSPNIFAPRVDNNGVGNQARNLTAADVDAANGLDLILSNDQGNDIAVILNNGSGVFGAVNNYNGGGKLANPRGIAAADFNGGTGADFAIANSAQEGGAYKLTILNNDGNGAFNTATNYEASTTNPPNGVAVGDFNGDGKPDVVIANQTDRTATVYLNDGAGNMGAGVPMPSGFDNGSVAVADFNKDGKPDIVAANAFGQVSGAKGDVAIYLGKGDGTFEDKKIFETGEFATSTVPVVNRPRAIAIGDFNGDTKPDIATLNDNPALASSISVLLNTSN